MLSVPIILPKSYNLLEYNGVNCLCIKCEIEGSNFSNITHKVFIPLSLLSIKYITFEESSSNRDEIYNLLCNEPVNYTRYQVQAWDSIVRIRDYQNIFRRIEIEDIKKHDSEANITTILSSLSHTPYCSFQIEGEYDIYEENVLVYNSVFKVTDLTTEKKASRLVLFVYVDDECNNICCCFEDNPVTILTMFPECKSVHETTYFTDPIDMIDTFIEMYENVDEIVSFGKWYELFPECSKLEQFLKNVEVVDLQNITKRVYPFYVKNDLETIVREQCLDVSNFVIHKLKYSAFLEECKSETLSENWLNVLENVMRFIDEKVNFVREIYKKLEFHRNIATELCGLTSESWSKESEAFGIINKINPKFLYANVEEIQTAQNVTQGCYFDIKVMMYKNYILKSFYEDTLLDNYITSVMSSDGVILKDCNYLYNQFLRYTGIIDLASYMDKVNDETKNAVQIYNIGAYVYLKSKKIEQKYLCHSYDIILIDSERKWAIINIEEVNHCLTFEDGHIVFNSIPKCVEILICKEIIASKKRTKNKKANEQKNSDTFRELLFPRDKVSSLYSFIINMKMCDKNRKYLLKDEVYDTNTEISLIKTKTKLVRVTYPVPATALDEEYYSNILKERLEILYEYL